MGQGNSKIPSEAPSYTSQPDASTNSKETLNKSASIGGKLMNLIYPKQEPSAANNVSTSTVPSSPLPPSSSTIANAYRKKLSGAQSVIEKRGTSSFFLGKMLISPRRPLRDYKTKPIKPIVPDLAAPNVSIEQAVEAETLDESALSLPIPKALKRKANSPNFQFRSKFLRMEGYAESPNLKKVNAYHVEEQESDTEEEVISKEDNIKKSFDKDNHDNSDSLDDTKISPKKSLMANEELSKEIMKTPKISGPNLDSLPYTPSQMLENAEIEMETTFPTESTCASPTTVCSKNNSVLETSTSETLSINEDDEDITMEECTSVVAQASFKKENSAHESSDVCGGGNEDTTLQLVDSSSNSRASSSDEVEINLLPPARTTDSSTMSKKMMTSNYMVTESKNQKKSIEKVTDKENEKHKENGLHENGKNDENGVRENGSHEENGVHENGSDDENGVRENGTHDENGVRENGTHDENGVQEEEKNSVNENEDSEELEKEKVDAPLSKESDIPVCESEFYHHPFASSTFSSTISKAKLGVLTMIPRSSAMILPSINFDSIFKSLWDKSDRNDSSSSTNDNETPSKECHSENEEETNSADVFKDNSDCEMTSPAAERSKEDNANPLQLQSDDTQSSSTSEGVNQNSELNQADETPSSECSSQRSVENVSMEDNEVNDPLVPLENNITSTSTITALSNAVLDEESASCSSETGSADDQVSTASENSSVHPIQKTPPLDPTKDCFDSVTSSDTDFVCTPKRSKRLANKTLTPSKMAQKKRMKESDDGSIGKKQKVSDVSVDIEKLSDETVKTAIKAKGRDKKLNTFNDFAALVNKDSIEYIKNNQVSSTVFFSAYLFICIWLCLGRI